MTAPIASTDFDLLREQLGKTSVSATTMNFIVWIDDINFRAWVLERTTKILEKHPARAILLDAAQARIDSIGGDIIEQVDRSGLSGVVAEVYPAGEAPIAGIDRDHLVLGLRAHGHREVVPLPSPAALAGVVHGIASPGDTVVCLGAGNITQWAYALPAELQALG